RHATDKESAKPQANDDPPPAWCVAKICARSESVRTGCSHRHSRELFSASPEPFSSRYCGRHRINKPGPATGGNGAWDHICLKKGAEIRYRFSWIRWGEHT